MNPSKKHTPSKFACAIFAWMFLWVPSAPCWELFEEEVDNVPDQVDKMYVRGLQYLVKNQNSSGAWGGGTSGGGDHYGTEPAVVGLSIISMLAHGDDPNTGPYSAAIRNGLNYILSKANPKNGYLGTTMYNHGFATLTLAECYGTVHDPRIGPALQKATDLILTSQKSNPLGAWRYWPEAKDADTTVSGAQMVALFAARNAGIAVPDEAIKTGIQYFLRCQTPEGGIGYASPGGASPACSAIGLLNLCLSKDKKSPAFKAAMRYVTTQASPDNAHYHYYLYYASQAHFHSSLPLWQEWNRINIKKLSVTQEADGSWNGNMGKTFGTATSLLSLALNYRYLPIYER